MKVLLLIMPRYYEINNKMELPYKPWKEFFYDIISEANKKYPFVFWDYKKHPISNNKLFYQDVSHFNYTGAINFTKIIDKEFVQT